MEITLGNVISVVIPIIVGAFGYGALNQKINGMFGDRENCYKRFQAIESNHTNSFEGIRSEMSAMNSTLNQLVGQINTFFSLYNANEKEHQSGH